MPPTATASTGSGTPIAMPIDTTPTLSSGFVGEEFVNNLGSDLAPLLTLFGEQVTKQFLSMSLGWADHILLAVGPLGIITTLVSAIRVANVRVLKAVIGRAREKLATAELELLSSTSNVTSELWTEDGIVRQPGHADILELVAYKSKSVVRNARPDAVELEDNTNEIHIGDLGEAYHRGVLKDADEGRSMLFKDVFRKLGFLSIRPSKIPPEQLAKQPPNLILNVHGALPKSRELWVFAMIGIAMQLVAVAIPAVMTYHWKALKGTNSVQDYAYPTFLTGTCLLIVGIAMCSYIIEATTVEQVFEPTGGHEVKTVFRLQLECTMGDQPFQTYVIVNDSRDDCIHTSRYDPDEIHDDDQRGGSQADAQIVVDDTSAQTSDEATVENAPKGANDRRAGRWWHITTYTRRISKTAPQNSDKTAKTAKVSSKSRLKAQKPIVIVAVIFCLAGFISQFVGLRALHWSATIIQLGTTLIMTGIRAWARIGISRKPIAIQLLDSNPNWIALSLGTACRSQWPKGSKTWPTATSPRFVPYDSIKSVGRTPITEQITVGDPRLELRQKLQCLSPEVDSDLVPHSRNLLRAMKTLMRFVHPSGLQTITWAHVVESTGLNDLGPQHARLKLKITSSSEKMHGYLDEDMLHAILAIWSYQYHSSTKIRCIAKVSSMDDCRAKYQFFSNRTCYFSSVTGHISRYDGEPIREEWASSDDTRFTGLSIEYMHDSTASSGPGENLLHGYLIIPVPNRATEFAFELLSGFMDALWQDINLKYNYRLKSWYTSHQGSDEVLRVYKIINSLVEMGLIEHKLDAELLVISSLARCTVWKDPPGSDMSPPSHTRIHPFFSPKPKAPATIEAEGNSRDSAITPEASQHGPIRTPTAATPSASAAAQGRGSSRISSVPPEASKEEP